MAGTAGSEAHSEPRCGTAVPRGTRSSTISSGVSRTDLRCVWLWPLRAATPAAVSVIVRSPPQGCSLAAPHAAVHRLEDREGGAGGQVSRKLRREDQLITWF